ncbi:CDP-glycerol glycerophosphotransferase family protein [Thermophilibacter provencensis]|uniref:CDP-glycerol glycerophosphotransferase family protein n=1 Tax=Thermophilibacter provencensis TaxID=1852386 RepID=A0ABT7V1J6_9ACTN|nr:CDP-glycerol glycerophosphotransferase family protein [Thermophilibacter provencensis]MDM8270483.1 CDP-glycerol glycerophosphotransferase family protein [Thermophilibacter provencensis]
MELVAWLIRVLFRALSLFPQQRKIVLLSRQAARPFDFSLIEPELARRFPNHRIVWSCVATIGEMSVPLMLQQLWHVATADLCLVDGYVPAVSLPRRHRALVVQEWHALGAIKKFGYQSLDTAAGRSTHAASALRMHRGYDFVIAGMPGAVEAFSEAFDVPREKIVPLGLPRIDYLCSDALASARARRFARADKALKEAFFTYPDASSCARTVLYAPTFRKGNDDPQWLEHAVLALCSALSGTSTRLVVAEHPLDGVHECARALGTPVAFMRGVPTIDLLHTADYVITDYSTVAFEAGFAGRPTLFYVPDIEEYRVSPGLNIDPLRELSTISFTDAHELAEVLLGARPYDAEAFSAFMDASSQGVREGSITRIVDALEDALARPKMLESA